MVKLCKCGCNHPVVRCDRQGNLRDYINGHNSRVGNCTTNHGYKMIRMLDHPRANVRGYVSEHILVVEKHFGRLLRPGEEIHHIDGNRQNNYIGNLIVFATKAMHVAYEHRLRAFRDCGHYDWLKCGYCHNYDSPNNLSVYRRDGVVYSARHASCYKKYLLELAARKRR